MSANIGTRGRGGTPNSLGPAPQFTDGQIETQRGEGLSLDLKDSGAQVFLPIWLLCDPRQGSVSLWALTFPSASPEVGRVGSQGKPVLFTSFRKSLGPQQQYCPTPTLPSTEEKGRGVGAAAAFPLGLHTPCPYSPWGSPQTCDTWTSPAAMGQRSPLPPPRR